MHVMTSFVLLLSATASAGLLHPVQRTAATWPQSLKLAPQSPKLNVAMQVRELQ